MTDLYHAGEIVFSAKLDAKGLKKDFTALNSDAAKAGIKASGLWSKKFGSRLVTGMTGGQFTQKLDQAISAPVPRGLPQSLAAFQAVGVAGAAALRRGLERAGLNIFGPIFGPGKDPLARTGAGAPTALNSDETPDADNIDAVKDLFKSGLKAAIDGDFEKFLAAKLQGAADKMFDKAIDGVLDVLFSAGGGAGVFGDMASLFAGFFADGGVVPRGQFAIVGEQGPEIISSGASPLRVTPINDNIAASHAARLTADGGAGRSMTYAPINNFYGHTQDDLRRSLDERDRGLKAEMPGLMDRHSFNRKRGMA